VSRNITQRELRNQSGEIMRGLDQGESFVITRNGVPVGQLTPFLRRQIVLASTARAAFQGAAPLDADRFRVDLDSIASQTATPRA
jgi:antitoxin (DNA-binding transcriptional repressor) of toxin-antitoxin stability system